MCRGVRAFVCVSSSEFVCVRVSVYVYVCLCVCVFVRVYGCWPEYEGTCFF